MYVHWGNEFINRPYIDQVQFAHLLVDMGTDLIVGMHPHVLQGYEIYKASHIFYSIGNFVFNMPTLSTTYSCAVKFSIDDSNKPQVSYFYIRIEEDYFPTEVTEEEVPHEYRFTNLNQLLNLKLNNEEYYNMVNKSYRSYRLKNNMTILKSLPKFKWKDLKYILTDFAKRRL